MSAPVKLNKALILVGLQEGPMAWHHQPVLLLSSGLLASRGTTSVNERECDRGQHFLSDVEIGTACRPQHCRQWLSWCLPRRRKLSSHWSPSWAAPRLSRRQTPRPCPRLRLRRTSTAQTAEATTVSSLPTQNLMI